MMFEPAKILPNKSAFTPLAGKPRPPWLLGAVAAIAVLAAVVTAWAIMGRSTTTTTALTQPVLIGDVEDTVTALGTLQPLQYVDVGTQVSGQLKVLRVDYSAMVKKGDLLAEIDPTIYQARVNADQAQLMNLRAQLAQRQAQRSLAALQFKRQQELLKESATSQDAYDTSDSNLKVNIAQIAALEAQIKQTESTLSGDMANLSYTQIFAPMDGTVVNLIAKQGQMLNANQTAPIVLRIADLDTMTVWAQVSEADVPKLKVGMDAYFITLGTSDRRRYGKLRKIIPTPDVVNNVVLYNCLFDVENPDGDLLTQMSAQVYFVVAAAHRVPIVPVTALHPVRGARPAGGPRGAGTPNPNAPTAMSQNAAPPAATPPADSQAGAPTPDQQVAAGDRPRGGRRMRDGGASNVAPKRYTVNVIKDGLLVSREVEVGVVNRMSAEIKSGLEPGEEVVLDGGLQASGNRPNQRDGQGPPGGPGGRGPRI
jgi:membrane fusion protein, macrolide-specific efflux system